MRVVGEGRIAADAEVVLHPSLGGQAVVVPAHGVVHLFALHALIPGQGVAVGVAEHVAHVEAAADGGGRGVDGVDLVAGGSAVEAVRSVGFPDVVPLGFEALERGLLGDVAGGRHRLVIVLLYLQRVAVVTRGGCWHHPLCLGTHMAM